MADDINSSTWWKYTATGLAGMVASGAVGWFSLWTVGMYRWQTDSQVREILSTESPYIKDSRLIELRFQKNEEAIQNVAARFDLLIEGQADLKTQTALIQATLMRMEKEEAKRNAK